MKVQWQVNVSAHSFAGDHLEIERVAVSPGLLSSQRAREIPPGRAARA